MRPPRCLFPAAEILLKAPAPTGRRCMSSAAAFQPPRIVAATQWKGYGFFISNRLFDRSTCLDFVILRKANGIRSTSASATGSTLSSSTTNSSSAQTEQDIAPHRKRQAQRRESHFLPMHPLYSQHTLLRSPVPAAAISPHASRSRNLD
jgi:protoheme IX farnesyltransferase